MEQHLVDGHVAGLRESVDNGISDVHWFQDLTLLWKAAILLDGLKNNWILLQYQALKC